MKQIMIIANWKMHLNVQSASLLVHRLDKAIKPHRGIEVVLAPTMLTLQPISLEVDRRKFRLAAQNAYFKDEGAYTGEVSFTMLRDIVDYALIGHSERRIYFDETLEVVRDKVQAAVRNGIKPVLCIGETRQERANGETRRVIHDQLTTALSNLTAEDVEDMTIAYEPVWAISTFDGELAKPDEIEKAFELIASTVAELYGQSTADSVRLIYGGSVDDHNAMDYLKLDRCQGFIVGGASLNHAKFTSIVNSAYRLTKQQETAHA